MNRILVVASLVLWLGCGGTPADADGGAGGGGHTGGGGGHTGGGGGHTGGGGGQVGGGGGDVGGGGGDVGGGGGALGGGTGGGAMPECTAGETRACCTTGVQSCSASGAWLPCTVTGMPEVCNGVDDDCDGQVDEDVTFTPGELADAGAEPDAGCTVGVGACARTAGVVCSAQGAATCGATAGTPGAETCNGVDDDCDGDVDEGVLVACLDDDDGDRYATDTTTVSMVCPDATRVDFGSCPAGFVAASASLGVDCAHGDATRFSTTSVRTDADGDGACVAAAYDVCAGSTLPTGVRATGTCALFADCDDSNASKTTLLSLRVDQDGDGACVGPASITCASPSAPAGFRLAVSCVGADDCDDADAMKSTMLQVRADLDGDGYCTGATAGLCTGGTAPAGYRAATSCNATDDCDDADAAKFVTRQVRADADADGYCVGAAVTQCQGASMVSGFRETISCASTDDCNDTSVTLYRTVTLRADADNDGYCAPGTVTLCTGTATPAGYRVPAQCNAVNDCKDTNPNATTTCVVSVNSTQFAKTCGIGPPPTESGSVTLSCPFGFFTAAPLTVHGTNAAISCSAGSFFTGQTSVQMSATCGTAYIGTGACYVSVQCYAN